MRKLKPVLAQEDTVLFVGSGLSLWSGLPSWTQLIEELATFLEEAGGDAGLVRSEAQKGDLLQAASYGFYKLTQSQIGDFIRRACRFGLAKPHEIHHALVTLGPRCYITTNYDTLLEESLRSWQPNRLVRSVSNRHLTELADIVHARARDFIFKPHGDAGDTASIILTREQYRQLLPGGERHAVLESLKMLLVSRPVVYIGFGLRDPDFIYLRDLLCNTYRGGIRDHYAVMADVDEGERDYWRANYGIHLLGYTTTKCRNGSRDHSELFGILEELSSTAKTTPTRPPRSQYTPCSPDTILALARHTAGLMRAPQMSPDFPLRVYLDRGDRSRGELSFSPDEFDHSLVLQFLERVPSNAILTGAPGAGKSYSIRRAAALLAESLHKRCLLEAFDHRNVTVPLVADLKLYCGDLYDLVNQTLPSGLSLEDLDRDFDLRIFLDSFNEMPGQYWDSGEYEPDFASFVARLPRARIVVGSRTRDGLSKLGCPVYQVSEVDQKFVETELARLGIIIEGRFEREIKQFLQKPFYFRLVASGAIALPPGTRPNDCYEVYFGNIRTSFRERFGASFDIKGALARVAFDSIEQGDEAQPVTSVLTILETELAAARVSGVTGSDVANWLVSRDVLVPYRGARVAFFHQSATEYLAASELARRYQLDPSMLRERLNLRRWDHALLMAVDLLPPDQSTAFVNTLLDVDLSLALRATKYMEFNRDAVVAKLLSEIPSRVSRRATGSLDIEAALHFGAAVSDVHEPELRGLMALQGSIGGAAVCRLVELKGASIKPELLTSLIEARDDYNYCVNGIAAALEPLATEKDIHEILVLADAHEREFPPDAEDEVWHGFIDGAGKLLSRLDTRVVRKAFLENYGVGPLPALRGRIFSRFLQEQRSTEALNAAADLLIRGAHDAATTLYFVAEFADSGVLDWSGISEQHVRILIQALSNPRDESWNIQALSRICRARPDLAEAVMKHVEKGSGLLCGILRYCACAGDAIGIFDALDKVARMEADERGKLPIRLLKSVELDWNGKETLFVKLLRLRDAQFGRALLDEVMHRPEAIGEIDIGPIEWWLEWIGDARRGDDGWWFAYEISSLFGRTLSPVSRSRFVAEFNRPDSRFRGLLAKSILPHFPDITTDALSDDAISFLLADLSSSRMAGGFPGHLLGSAATEQFVVERLLPLLDGAKPPLAENLRSVLITAGGRHARRYVAT